MWARIEGSVVAELTDVDPRGRYHESLIWQACSDDVGYGWSFLDGVFSEPLDDSNEILAANERYWRDGELASNEWLITRHRDEQEVGSATTLTDEQYSQLLLYRKELRDWPINSDFPDSAARPLPPEWLQPKPVT